MATTRSGRERAGMPRLARTVALVAASAALVAACSGGTRPELEAGTSDDGASPTATGEPAPTEVTPTTTDAATPEPTDTETPTPAATPTSSAGGSAAMPTPAPVSGAPAFTSASKLSTAGLDEVFFGDTVEQAADRLGSPWVGLPEGGDQPECYTVQAAGEPRGVVFTVWSGHIERVDITTDVITTLSGAGVGSTAADLDALFGDKLVTTAIDGGDEIAFVPQSDADKEFRIIWTTDGTAAVSMRAGRIPIVTPPIPCG